MTDTASTPTEADLLDSGLLELMAESISFLSERFGEDVATQQALLACRTPADVLEVQAGFYRTALEQYAAEAGRLMTLLPRALTASGMPGSSRRYDDIPL